MKNIYGVILLCLSTIFMWLACDPAPIDDIDKESIFLKLYGGREDQTGWDVAQRVDGGYVIVGTTNSFLNDSLICLDSQLCVEAIDVTNTDSVDLTTVVQEQWGVYIISTDAQGNEQWSRLLGIPLTRVRGTIVRLNAQGNSVVLVDFNQDLALVEVNDTGGVVRQQVLDSSFDWFNQSFKGNMQIEEDGGIVVIGNVLDANNTDYSVGVVKLDSDWNIEWEESYGTLASFNDGIDLFKFNDSYVILSVSNNKELSLIQVTLDGRLFFENKYGFIKSISLTDNRPQMTLSASSSGGLAIVTSSDSSRLKLIEVDENLQLLSNKDLQVGIEGVELRAKSIQTLDDGYIILASGIKSNSADGRRDYFLIRTDIEGEVIFAEQHGNEGDNNPSRILVAEDGGFVVLGTTDFSVNTMIFLAKTNANGTLIPNN